MSGVVLIQLRSPHNVPGAADGIKIVVAEQRLLAAADQERYAYSINLKMQR